MNNIFIDVDYDQIYKDRQKIGGDVFLLSKNPDRAQIVATLSDGMGSGVKANVLASLTAHMAHKLSFSDMDLSRSAKIIMDTLPVCKERKISYSTFTIANISFSSLEHIGVQLIEYDNPDVLRFSGEKLLDWDREKVNLNRDGAFKKEILKRSEFQMKSGDRLIMFSDGVTQSGMGMTMPLGWRLSGVRSFAEEVIARDPDIASHDLAHKIVRHAYQLDGMQSKDDITCAVVYVRKPRRTLVVTGPPFNKESDAVLGERVKNFNGRTIVSGGTTAQIISRELGSPITVDLKHWSRDVPPMSEMDGVSLVTEGMLTLSKVVKMLEERVPLTSLADNAVKRFVKILLNSDQVHFIVGTKINEAHQDPNIPAEIGIRRTMIARLRDVLEKLYLKETSLEYM